MKIELVPKEWQEKRAAILNRDNFTCQNIACKTFNPSLGLVQVQSENSILELHQYSSAFESVYTLYSDKTELTIEINFGPHWLVMPVMQVHHKRYINGRQRWEYDDSDLVTLCKRCHNLLHQTHTIPIFDFNGEFMYEKILEPEVYEGDHNHLFEPWTFINKVTGEYESTKIIQPTARTIVFTGENESLAREKTVNMITDFLKKYVGNA